MNQVIFSKKIKKDDNKSLLSWRKKLLLRTTDKRLKKKYSDKQSDMLSLLSAIELELNKRSLKKQNYAVAEGLMSYHGYRVGETNGVSDEVRQEILRRIFTGPVMPVIGKWYMSEWGEDKSLERLNKIESNFTFLASKVPISSIVCGWKSEIDKDEKIISCSDDILDFFKSKFL